MTEKNYNPKQKERKSMEKQPRKIIEEKPVEIQKKTESSPNVVTSLKEKETETSKQEEKKEEKKTETDKPAEEKKEVKKEVQKIKKTEAVVNSFNLPISTKDAAAICRFIKYKKIRDAIADLEQVKLGKKAVPMKGEIPHRKGKGMMSGRFPKNSAGAFLILLRSLAANASEFDEPIITEAVANIGSRPYGRFGRTRKKRTHIKITAKEKAKKEEKK